MPDGFDSLFLAHYGAVYRLAFRIAGTREEAEDLTQEAFIRLHKAPGVWEGKGETDPSVRGWLYRVVTNLAYNSLRGRARTRRREERTVQGGSASEEAAFDIAERAALQQAVRSALATLEVRHVQLLLLRQEGLSYRELAEALGVAPGSIGTLLARAEAAFERAYRKQEER